MKHLRFHFCHPIKGHACLIRLLTEKSERYDMVIDSKGETILEIPINNYNDGKWRIVLDWEHDGQLFSHQKEFEIKNHKPLI